MAADLFLGHFGLDRGAPPADLLRDTARAFSRIPYENLTKILKLDREGSAERARRHPPEVVADHIALGAGGTCFSLTAALLHIVRALGFEAQPILADRKYGPNTHCAMVVTIDRRPHLIDPGFLITEAIPLDGGEVTRLATAFNEVVLTRRKGGAEIDLHTLQKGNRTYRLSFKAAPADPGEFLKAWDDSFTWDMMRYPLLTRVAGDRQLYLQGLHRHLRSREGIQRDEIGLDELPARIGEDFGVDPRIAARAIEVLRRKGELP
jgi:arylamine N-acetyltransferase